MRKTIKYFCWTGNDGYLAVKAIIFDFFREKERLSLEELINKIKDIKEKHEFDLYIFSGDRSKAADVLTFAIDRLQILEKHNELYQLSNEAKNLRKYQDERAFKRELLKLSYLKGEKKFTDFILLLKELLKKYKMFGKIVQKSNLRDTLRNYGLDSGGNKYMLPYLLSLGVLRDAGIYYEITPESLSFVDDLRLEIFKKILKDAYELKIKGGKFFTYEDAVHTFTYYNFSREEAVETLKKLHDMNVFIIHQSGNMKILRM
jgi:hypothetical protein